MSSWKWMAAVALGGWLGVCGVCAQNADANSPNAISSQASSASQTPAKPDASSPSATQGKGKVLFSKSDDDPAQTAQSTQKPTDSTLTQPAPVGAASVLQATAEERDALTITSYDLDVHLVPRQESLSVRARMTVRNDSDKPLKRIALQLSSTLNWERIRAGEAEATFSQSAIATDTDHTGAVSEALITLPHELAPKSELNLEVFYSGTVPLTGKRLEPGTSSDVSTRFDWSRISPEFIGLRGFGFVTWYPVSAQPMKFREMYGETRTQRQRWERRQWPARVKMTVTSEFTADTGAPNVAILDGQVVPIVQTAAPEDAFPGVVTASLPETAMGFSPPSIFLLNRQITDAGGEASGARVVAAAEEAAQAQQFAAAIDQVTPTVRKWLGPATKTPMVVIALPDSLSDPEPQGALFFTGLARGLDPGYDLPYALAGSLAHAYFRSPRVWLSEGVPQFVQILGKEETVGRQTALTALAGGRNGLAMAEPATPGENGGESLIDASDSVYYVGKSAYVLWMLRDLAGDANLAAVLQAYVPEQDTTPDYFEHLLEKISGKDLKWFFDDWVYRDRGLPDLFITGVYPSQSATDGQWLVALDIANNGYAEVEVPVTVRSKGATVTERLRIPAQGKISRRILVGGTPTEVQLNDGSVPEVRESAHLMKLTPEVK